MKNDNCCRITLKDMFKLLIARGIPTNCIDRFEYYIHEDAMYGLTARRTATISFSFGLEDPKIKEMISSINNEAAAGKGLKNET